MRALLLNRPGEPETLRYGSVPRPVLGAGEVRIRVQAGGLNPVDVGLARRGHPSWSWPHIPGLDFAGIVEAVGPEAVGDWQVGDRVAGHNDLRRQGALADYIIADPRILARIPDRIESTTAAALPCAGMTAYQAVVRRLRVTAGQMILVTGGAGGVGGFAVQLAALAGARVLATTSAANADYVKGLGAAEVIDYNRQDVAATVRSLTDGRGVDGVVDAVGAESATANLALLVHSGGLAAIAGAPDLSVVGFGIAPSVHQIALGAAHSHGSDADRADLSAMLTDLLALVAAGTLDPTLSRVVDVDAAPAALTELAGRHVRGKIVAQNTEETR